MKFLPKNLAKKIPKPIRSKRAILAAIAIIIFLFFATRGGANEDLIKTVPVEEKTIQEKASASGKIHPARQAGLHFQTSGKIAWISAEQGDYVKASQIIASLDTQDLEKRLKRDLNTYFKTRLDFEDVKDSQQDQVITDTLKRIAQRSQKDLDNSVIDVEIRDLAVKSSTLASPISGYVISKPNFYAQSNILATDTIITVAGLAKPQFIAEVDETDIGKVKLGQKAQIKLDAFPDETIEASVDKIAPASTITSTGATAFEVTASLADPKKYLLGMNGEAEIITHQTENTRVIPVDAIIDDNYVWIKQDNKYQKRQVAKGIQSDTEQQIVYGLEKGETVIISGFDQIGKKSLLQKIFEKLT